MGGFNHGGWTNFRGFILVPISRGCKEAEASRSEPFLDTFYVRNCNINLASQSALIGTCSNCIQIMILASMKP